MFTIIASTNRPNSRTLSVARTYESLLAEKNIKIDFLSLTDLPKEFLFSDLYGKRSEEFQPIAELIEQTKVFFFIVPEYNGCFPGVLKLFIDSLDPPRYFHRKTAVLIGLSAGKFGNVRGIDNLTGVLNYLQVSVYPFKAHIPQVDKKMDEHGVLTDPASLRELNMQLSRFFEDYKV